MGRVFRIPPGQRKAPASIGVVYVDVLVGAASLFLQAGDGWDRVI
jgi:hypothetical protein